MAVATTRTRELAVAREPACEHRPAKRVKYGHGSVIQLDGPEPTNSTEASHEDDGGEDHISLPIHPLRIRPSGNSYVATHDLRNAIQGPLGKLPDAVLVQLLDTLGCHELRRLGYTCKAMWGFCHLDEQWRNLFMRAPDDACEWQGSWRCTVLKLVHSLEAQIDCSGLFSDLLYRPFHCSSIPLQPYCRSIPSSCSLPRFSDLSPEVYATEYAKKPFILTGIVPHWPVQTSGELAVDTLLKTHPSTPFRAESVSWPFSSYIDYARSTTDESPLYLFDHAFASKLPLESPSFTVPACFGEDLFSHLGSKRPHGQWLIIGPARSGSTFHKDPNSTSAWNAVLSGRKYWLLFPPGVVPPGVHMSADESEVTSPLSIAEWLLEFHAEARLLEGGVEGVCGAGEVLHVPAGWWHLVVNLEESVALTGNFVSEAGLTDTLMFLRDKRDQVSGYNEDAEGIGGVMEHGGEGRGLYEEFSSRVEQARPQVFREALASLERRDAGKQQRSQWGQTVETQDDQGGFSFGFTDDQGSEWSTTEES